LWRNPALACGEPRIATSKKGAFTTHYHYDGNGNFTGTTATATNSYDGLNRLVRYVKGSKSASDAYNALGQRVQKNVNGSNTLFVYDPAGHLIGEYDGSGQAIEETIWLGDLPVAVQA
jgi:uncharacterized protein RhaS with RHS repeats